MYISVFSFSLPCFPLSFDKIDTYIWAPHVALVVKNTSQCRKHKGWGLDPWVGKIPWRMEWQPTPVFLPGEFPWTEEPGRLQSRSLAGYSPWRHKELEYLTQRLDWNPDSPIYNICIVISLNPYLLSSKMQRMLVITFPQIVVLNEILNVSVFWMWWMVLH